MVPVLIAAGAALFAGGVAVGKSLGNEGKEEGQNILYPRMWTRSKKGWGKNRENTVQMKILSGTKKTFS